MSGNVVYLKFHNKNTSYEEQTFVTCAFCKNKTFTAMIDTSSDYALMKCAACGAHMGRIGWADIETNPIPK